METTENQETVEPKDLEYERLVSIWNRVLDRLKREGDASHMRDFIKNALLAGVENLPGYHIVLVADYWYNKYILREEDLSDIVLAVRTANGGRLCAEGYTEEEQAWAEEGSPY